MLIKTLDNGILFRCFNKDYSLNWKDLATHLGFHNRCSIDLKFSLSGYNRHAFWHLISAQNVVGRFQPNNMNIHHPILRFIHRWIAMVIFARDDVHHVQDIELKVLYAILKEIQIAPVQELVKHWLNSFKTTTPIMCMSLITRLVASVDALDR